MLPYVAGNRMHWDDLAGWLIAALKIGLGLLFIRFWIRTRFWVPRYVHWMAAAAFLVGLGMLRLIPAEAPLNRGTFPLLNKVLVVFLFPAIVYAAFVFYGGQEAAYQARTDRIICPHCGGTRGFPGSPCTACGQTIS